MNRYNLSILDDTTKSGGGRTALLRNMIGNYARFNGSEEFLLLGTGFTKLDENPGAQSESEVYINETTASSDITSYKTEFSYETRLIKDQRASYKLWKMGRDHATGDDAQLDHCVVDLFNPIGTPTDEVAEYAARLFRVTNVVDGTAGNGGEKLNISGKLEAVGDPIQGKFDTVSKTFTEGTFYGVLDDKPAEEAAG